MSFEIERFTRVSDDKCFLEVQNADSANPGLYRLTNLVPAASTTMSLAYSQPAVSAAAGYGWSASHIDTDSRLRISQIQTISPGCPLRPRTQARPFVTVPYMGRGHGDADTESRLQQSEFVRSGKECGTISDTFYANQFTPLIPHVAANIQNPKHIIPEVASPGWVRAGVPSRQWVRDQNC